MKYRILNSVRTLAATLITLGALAGGAHAAITLSWEENAGDGNDVKVTLGGSYTIQNIEAQNNSYSGIEFESGYFADSSHAGAYNWERGGIVFVNFVSYATPLASSTINLHNDIRLQQTSGLAIPDTLSVGESFTPTGYVLFADSTFESLFGSGTAVADFVRYQAPDGSDGVISTVIPEPSSAFLLGLAGLGFVAARRTLKVRSNGASKKSVC